MARTQNHSILKVPTVTGTDNARQRSSPYMPICVRVKTSGVFRFSKNYFPRTQYCRSHIRYAFKSVHSKNVKQLPKSEFNFPKPKAHIWSSVWCRLSLPVLGSCREPFKYQIMYTINQWRLSSNKYIYCWG